MAIMTQTEKIKKFLEEKGLGSSCNEQLKKFNLEVDPNCTYSAFRRVYITYNEGKNILQDPSVVGSIDPRFKTIEHVDKHGIKYLTWEAVPVKEQPDEQHVAAKGKYGAEVLICDYFLAPSSRYFLVAVHKKGEKGWKENGGYTVLEESTKGIRCFLAESVRLHPSFIK